MSFFQKIANFLNGKLKNQKQNFIEFWNGKTSEFYKFFEFLIRINTKKIAITENPLHGTHHIPSLLLVQRAHLCHRHNFWLWPLHMYFLSPLSALLKISGFRHKNRYPVGKPPKIPLSCLWAWSFHPYKGNFRWILIQRPPTKYYPQTLNLWCLREK